MRKLLSLLLVLASFLSLAASSAFAAEASFERSYKVKGLIQLSVGTSLGSIHINVGAPNRIHLIGHVKSDWAATLKTVSRKSPTIPQFP